MITQSLHYCNEHYEKQTMLCEVCNKQSIHIFRGLFYYYKWWFLPLFPGKQKIEQTCSDCGYSKLINPSSELTLDSNSEILLLQKNRTFYYLGSVLLVLFILFILYLIIE